MSDNLECSALRICEGTILRTLGQPVSLWVVDSKGDFQPIDAVPVDLGMVWVVSEGDVLLDSKGNRFQFTGTEFIKTQFVV